MFTYALEQQIVDSNPCIGVRRLLERKRDRYITHGEFQAICTNSSDHMRSIYETCYLTGQRIGDVLAIRLADISAEGIAFKQKKTNARLLVQMTPDLEDLIARIKALSDTDDRGDDAQTLGGHTDAKMTQRYLHLRKINVGLPPTMPKKSL